MRPFPATKLSLFACALCALLPVAAFAQAQQQLTPAQQQQAAQMMAAQQQAAMQQMAAALATIPQGPSGGGGLILAPEDADASGGRPRTAPGRVLTQKELDELLADSDSAQSKADRLATKRKQQRDLEKTLKEDAGDDDGRLPPPQDIEELMEMSAASAMGHLSDADDPVVKPGAGLDMRRESQKEAALSYGARGGLAKRNFQIMERLDAFGATLDKVFSFRALLIPAPSGLMIEPPIVRESINSLLVTSGGNEAAVAERIYDINKQAKIVTAPRDWRQYLVQGWVSVVPRPPRILWPKNDDERVNWREWIQQGWRAGSAQADAMFEANLARMVADYNGMVRYRVLLTQGMISQPYAMHEDRGVTGGKTVMRVGDRALKITGPSQFLTGSDLWKPADR